MEYPLPKSFKLDFTDLKIVARGLNRPECVLALSNGRLVTAHGSGGYSVIEPNGEVRHILIRDHAQRKYVPNGIALADDGQVMFADLGAQDGGIFSIDGHGNLTTVIDKVDGVPVPPSNFVVNDRQNRLWFTVSTRQRPRNLAWNHDIADGYIAVMDQKGVRIVADNIGYTNEVIFSPDGHWLYVNETYGQKTSRFPLYEDGSLGLKEVIATYDGANFPDGLTFDAFGGIWVTCIGSNRLIVIRPNGELQVVLEDTDTEYEKMLTQKVNNKTLQPLDMSSAGRSRLANISSLAFGGPSLTTAYLGCLLDDFILSFESPVPGLVPVHWSRDIKLPLSHGQVTL